MHVTIHDDSRTVGVAIPSVGGAVKLSLADLLTPQQLNALDNFLAAVRAAALTKLREEANARAAELTRLGAPP